MPAKNAAITNELTLTRAVLTPIASAAISFSRTARSWRPFDEVFSRYAAISTIVTNRDPQTGALTGYTIDPDGPTGAALPFTVDNPDFNLRSLRGTGVLRWEYRPGSTLFVVWTRSSRIPDRPEGDIRGGDFGDLFQGPSENVFLVKVNYWLGF